MENLLRSKDYWSVVGQGIPSLQENATPENVKSVEDARLKDLKAKNYLFQAIERGIIETMLTKSTAKEIWDSMKERYQGSTKVKKAQLQALKKEYEKLQMKDDEGVADFFTRTLTLVNKMKAQGKKMSQSSVVEKILRSMNIRFEYVVCSIVESNDVETMTIDQLQSKLVVHESRMKSLETHKGEEQALKATVGGRSGGSTRGRGRGRGRGRQGSNKDNIECYKCGKLGHYKNECPSWEEGANFAEFDEEEAILLMATKDEEKTDKRRENMWFLDSGYCAEFDEKDAILLMVTKNEEKTDKKREAVWFLDSGCSNHMCGHRNWFSSFDGTFTESVRLGNGTRSAVKGKGTVKLKIGGIIQIVTDVYYVPDLKNNLLSINGQLQEKGLKVVFEDNKCEVFHKEKGLIITSTMTKNRMFIITGHVIPLALLTEFCHNVEDGDVPHLWHCRFAHLSHKGLKILCQKEMVRGLPTLQEPLKTCEDCLKGKQHREVFPKESTWRAAKVLELVHSDICGPITPESNSQKRKPPKKDVESVSKKDSPRKRGPENVAKDNTNPAHITA